MNLFLISIARAAKSFVVSLLGLSTLGSQISNQPSQSHVPSPQSPIPSSQFLLLAATLALLSGCGHKPEAHTNPASNLPAATVRVQNVESKPAATTEEVVGTVRAKLHATLEAKVSGRIERMPVFLGQKVKAGELVARLDAAEIKARFQQAEASLQQAERDWKRIKALFDQQAVTRTEYDAADSRYLVAKAAVAEAQAVMDYVEVRAPFDGVVTKKWVDVGDLAAPGKPLINIQDPAVLQLDADLPEAIASRVPPEARLSIRLEGQTNELTGTVSEIAPTADPLSRTFRVKLDLPASSLLRSGQFARLVVPLGESRSLRVPASAVVQRGQLEIAFVAANQTAQLHLVKTGRHLGSEVEILAGLEPGDPVVIEGAAQLVDGQPLTLK